jgi:myo-inositol-1(or 4)-monophosphatase
MMSYEKDLELLKQAALEASVIIMKYFGTNMDVEHKSHAGFSPVTIADKEADVFLQAYLMGKRPSYGWLSEEIEDDKLRLQKESVFVVDPIDGTKPFIKGEPEFTVSLAIVENGKPVVGVVYNPAKKDMYASAKGLGMFLNGKQVDILADAKELMDMECLVSHSELRKGLWQPFDGEFLLNPVGSMAYKLAMVAAGQSDFTITLRPKSEWDCAAGHIMCEEMDLKVTDIWGEDVLYNQQEPDGGVDRMIVAPKHVFEKLQKRVIGAI